jgi:hypothetical protein
MSKRVILISLLLCLFGLWNIWEVIAALLANRIEIEFGVLFFPAGCGLLMGHRYARSMASLVFVLYYLGLALGIFLLPLAKASGVTFAGLPPELAPYAMLVAMLLTLAVALFIHWQLYTKPFDEHLSAP